MAQNRIYKTTGRFIALFLPACFLLSGLKSIAQSCPPNIDFERGDFTNWTCYIGSVSAANGQNQITIFPISGPNGSQHTMYSAASASGLMDYYGNFPVLCPNGSGHSVKLGNTEGGAQAEGLSYEFIIPANRNTYSIIYNYAVVFQDPNHLEFQQPRLELEVTDETTNQIISCSSFTFFPNGSPLPGFFQSPNSDSTAVWCKDWSAVTINLNGKAGRKIKLLFKTADCTFRRHFGYAYIDVNTECSSEFVGATYCPDDTAVHVTAPYGYQNYNWYNNNFTQQIGNQQVLVLTPPPPTGTTVAVEIIPYNGYGCLDTLYAQLVDTLRLTANAGLDKVACNNNAVLVGSSPKQGVSYQWTPATGLSNATVANPSANPTVTTNYTLTVRSAGGGCVNSDQVLVTPSVIDSTLNLEGKDLFCINTGDSAVLVVQPQQSITWLMNGSPVSVTNNPRFRVNKTGLYSAQLVNDKGCTISTRDQLVTVEVPRTGITYPVRYAVMNYPLLLQARNFGTTYSWSPPTYLSNAELMNPVFTSPAVSDQFYTIDIKTAAGCLTTDRQLVKTIKEVKVYVPSAFTPDNNGLNDDFKPIPQGIRELEYFRVFNRWGQQVFATSEEGKGWDGTINGITQPAGVYVWMFKGIGLDNKIYLQKGTITLIR